MKKLAIRLIALNLVIATLLSVSMPAFARQALMKEREENARNSEDLHYLSIGSNEIRYHGETYCFIPSEDGYYCFDANCNFTTQMNLRLYDGDRIVGNDESLTSIYVKCTANKAYSIYPDRSNFTIDISKVNAPPILPDNTVETSGEYRPEQTGIYYYTPTTLKIRSLSFSGDNIPNAGNYVYLFDDQVYRFISSGTNEIRYLGDAESMPADGLEKPAGIYKFTPEKRGIYYLSDTYAWIWWTDGDHFGTDGNYCLSPERTYYICAEDGTAMSYSGEFLFWESSYYNLMVSGYCGEQRDVTIPETIGKKSVIGISDLTPHAQSEITSVTIPNCVTNIGGYAFADCPTLQKIHIAPGNKNYFTDGNGVLFNKGGTTLLACPAGKTGEYIIPDNVTAVGVAAFRNCRKFTNMTIPDSVTDIGKDAFYACSGLTSVTIPDSVISLGDRAFSYCSRLTEVTLGNGVTSIGEEMFSYCSDLADVAIPNSVTSIGSRAFLDCNSLSSLEIPDSVTHIGNNAFSYCSSLTDVTVPDSVTNIDARAFYGCDSLTSITILNESCSIYNWMGTLGVPGMTIIYGYPGSSAEAYAMEWGYSFCPLGTGSNGGTGSNEGTDTPGSDDKNPEQITTYYENHASNGGICTEEFDFSDSYFSGKAATYNHSLAMASLGMVLSAVTYGDKGDYYIRDVLEQLGCESDKIKSEKFDNNSATDDTCAYIFGVKYMEDTDTYLLPVAIRSFGYGGEWVSNFHVTESGYAEYAAGFKKAADSTYSALMQYISDMGIDINKVKLWVTGFSRGGAVANLLGAKLTESSGVPQDNIYVYTFATPNAVKNTSAINYKNIFNIVSEADLVPRVALTSWGFMRYGTTYYLPCHTTRGTQYRALTNKMQEEYDKITNRAGAENTSMVALSGQEIALDLLVDYLDDVVPTSKEYARGGYQQIIMGFMNSSYSDQDYGIIYYLLQGHDDLAESIIDLMFRDSKLNLMERILKLRNIIDSIDAIGDLAFGAKDIIKMLVEFAVRYDARFIGEAISGKDYTSTYNVAIFLLGDVLENGMSSLLFKQHWGESYLAWMRSGSADELFQTYSYKRVSVKCPVDVTVYNSEDKIVARIINDIVDTSIEHSVYVSVNAFGEKELYLPDNEIYRIEVSARENGELDIVSSAYDAEGTLQKTDCYLDISMKTDQLFVIETDINNDSPTVQTEDEMLTVDVSSTEGDGTVSVVITNETWGLTFGDGDYSVGDTVKLIAMTDFSYGFDGWYQDGTYVSAETVYNFTAAEDCSFEAKFHEHKLLETVSATSCTEVYTINYTCSICDFSTEQKSEAPLGHAWSTWTTVVHPTGTQEGREERNCSRCNAVESRTLKPVSNPFNDVKESDYYYNPILWAVEKGITNGTGKGKFSPENPCTRGQIVTFLWRACGSPEPTEKTNPFSDVASSAYYYKAVLWAVENGITTGTGKGKFSPEDTCTRGQVATFLWRAQGKPTPTLSNNPFNDVNSDAYYYNAILWAVEKGVTNGTGKGKFSPDDSCTRGQIVTFLYRALS